MLWGFSNEGVCLRAIPTRPHRPHQEELPWDRSNQTLAMWRGVYLTTPLDASSQIGYS
jgi:hypothetical protein